MNDQDNIKRGIVTFDDEPATEYTEPKEPTPNAEPEFVEAAEGIFTGDTETGESADPKTAPKIDWEQAYYHEYAKAATAKEPKYVTQRALIVALVIAVLVSTLLGAGVATLLSRNAKTVSYSTLSKGSSSKELSVEEIVARNENAVVEINTTVQSESFFGTTLSQGAGSGVIVKEDGYIITNYHVIEGAQTISVRLHSGEVYSAQVVGFSETNDIAVIKIDAKGLTAAEIGTSSELVVGNLAVVIGNPLGRLGGTVTSGIISSLDRELTLDGRTLNLLQTDAAINAGNSGGGLFNGRGQLVGIVVGKGSGVGIEGLGFAIPIDTAGPIADDIIKNGTITGKPQAGITIYDVQNEDGSISVTIESVNGSHAKEAGLQKGDVVLQFNGEDVKNTESLVAEIQKHKIDEEVTFKIRRNKKEMEIKLKLQSSTEIR